MGRHKASCKLALRQRNEDLSFARPSLPVLGSIDEGIYIYISIYLFIQQILTFRVPRAQENINH